jgi:hypothetical protein
MFIIHKLMQQDAGIQYYLPNITQTFEVDILQYFAMM